MAILINKAGKFAETNKATLQRLAASKGDNIGFTPFQDYELVSLNGVLIGPLFPSHEAAIIFLAKESSALKKTGQPSASFRANKPRPAAKKNPGTDLTPLFSKPIGKALQEQILKELRARKGTLNDALKASAEKHGVAAIRIYTIAKKAGLTTSPKR